MAEGVIAPNRTGDVGGHVGMLQFSALVAGFVSLGARVAYLIDPAAITALRFVLAGAIIGGTWVIVGPGLNRHDFRASWRLLLCRV